MAVLGLSATERHAKEALAAQTRLEAWSSLSTKFSEWMLTRLMQNSEGDDAPIEAALNRLERLTAEDVAAAPSEAEASRRAAEIRHIAKMKSFFKQLRSLPAATSAGRAGFAFHMTHAPSIITGRIEQETRRRDAALNGLERLRRPLRFGVAAFAIAAPLLLLVLWRGTLHPLLSGLRMASAEVGRLNGQQMPKGPRRHDELGLMFARLRMASARINRRRARLERDLANLETLVAARTAELSDANHRLSAIDAARRRFFADVSHELRTPLTVILGEAELGATTSDPELRQSFQTITARAERLFRRIEDLLRIARSETGQLELECRTVRLDEALSAATEDVAPLLARGEVRLVRDLEPNLVLQADPDWLRQIFAGIFENSVKFAGRGTKIHVEARREGARVLIRITDNGPGPQPPLEAPLFDRHARRAPPSVSGFGIGLALAHWAAQKFGGELRRLPLQQGFGLELDLEAAGD